MTPSQQRFGRYAVGVVLYNIFVILWGAFVRATGSGAGCGDHWPDCNGEVIPWDAGTETLIEFTHRATSGLALLSTVVLIVWAFRAWPTRHRVRRAAAASMFFMVMEAAVGAALVLLELVAHNDSVARAWVMGAHLVNTFLLMGALTLTAWWGRGSAGSRRFASDAGPRVSALPSSSPLRLAPPAASRHWGTPCSRQTPLPTESRRTFLPPRTS